MEKDNNQNTEEKPKTPTKAQIQFYNLIQKTKGCQSQKKMRIRSQNKV